MRRRSDRLPRAPAGLAGAGTAGARHPAIVPGPAAAVSGAPPAACSARTASRSGRPAAGPWGSAARSSRASVRPRVQPLHRPLHLPEQVAAVVGDGELLLPLERLGPGVGLVAPAPSPPLCCSRVISAKRGRSPRAARRSPGPGRCDLGELLHRPVARRQRRPVGGGVRRGAAAAWCGWCWCGWCWSGWTAGGGLGPGAGAAGGPRSGRGGGAVRLGARAGGTAPAPAGGRGRGGCRCWGNHRGGALVERHLRGRCVLRHGRPHRLHRRTGPARTCQPRASVMESSRFSSRHS